MIVTIPFLQGWCLVLTSSVTARSTLIVVAFSASATLTTTIILASNGVVLGVLVVAGAVSLPSVVVDAVPHSVAHILAASSPAQVAQVVVGWIIIQVPRLHALRTRPDEGLQHDDVHVGGPIAHHHTHMTGLDVR
jgi:hypothetical protein